MQGDGKRQKRDMSTEDPVSQAELQVQITDGASPTGGLCGLLPADGGFGQENVCWLVNWLVDWLNTEFEGL